MSNQNVCTAFEAAAIWDLSRSGDDRYDGLTLVLDMDHASAGICQCTQDKPPRQLWEHTGNQTRSFFRDAIWTLLPGCSSPEAEHILYQSLTDICGSRAQKKYLQATKPKDFPLTQILVDGREYSMTCNTLEEVFNRTFLEPLNQMLDAALAELDTRGAKDTCRIIPFGTLADLYLAEYTVRTRFFQIPTAPNSRLRLCSIGESHAEIVQKGTDLYRQSFSKEKRLKFDIYLHLLHRIDKNNHQPGSIDLSYKTELIPLAKRDSLCSSLATVNYFGPIGIVTGVDLPIYADTEKIPVRLPRTIMNASGMTLLEAGIGADDEELFLYLRNPSSGKTDRIPLRMPE